MAVWWGIGGWGKVYLQADMRALTDEILPSLAMNFQLSSDR